MPRIFLPKARGTKRTSFLLISPHLCVKCSTLFPDKKIIHFFFQRATAYLFFYYYSDLYSFQKPVPLSATPKHIPSHRSIPTFPLRSLITTWNSMRPFITTFMKRSSSANGKSQSSSGRNSVEKGNNRPSAPPTNPRSISGQN